MSFGSSSIVSYQMPFIQLFSNIFIVDEKLLACFTVAYSNYGYCVLFLQSHFQTFIRQTYFTKTKRRQGPWFLRKCTPSCKEPFIGLTNIICSSQAHTVQSQCLTTDQANWSGLHASGVKDNYAFENNKLCSNISLYIKQLHLGAECV